MPPVVTSATISQEVAKKWIPPPASVPGPVSVPVSAFPKLEWGPPIESKLTPEVRAKRLELILSIFQSIEKQGTNPNTPYTLDKQRVIELIKTRDSELTAQGFQWNKDFNFFIKLLDRPHAVDTIFLAKYAHDIFHILNLLHKTDPTMSPPKSDPPIDIIGGNIRLTLRHRFSADEIKSFEQLAKKVLGVDQK